MSAPVLVAYDPVARDRAPVRFGATVAGFTGAPLYVASVYATEEVVEPLAAAQMGEDLPRDPGDALAEVARDIGGERVAVETLALGAASVPRALDLAAVQVGAGVVVVGSAARGQPGRVAPGSTAQRVLNGSPAAVAVVPREWDREREAPLTGFGAGFVETADGEAAVRGAHALAQRAGAPLRVVSAIQPPSWSRSGASGSGVDDELRVRAENAAEAATPMLPGIRVDIDVAPADPVDALLAVSEEVDLLVCGSRSYGPGRSAVLGGVTRCVTARAACPVIVLAHEAEVELDALIAGA